MNKKIKINDNRAKKVAIIVLISLIIILLIVILLKRTINIKLAKEIVIEKTENTQEIEWFAEEYEGTVDIYDIIEKNLDEQIKTIIETQIVELEYETEYQNTSKLPTGTVKVSQKGKDGKQELIIKKQYKGKELIVDEQIGRRVITPTKNKIIQVGVGSFYDVINGSGDDIEYSSQELVNKLNKNIPLNQKSGLTLNQFKKLFENEKKDKNGVFCDNAEYFYYVEQEYGINGVFVAALAIHESNWGTSRIAQDKKNLFGYGAYDMNSYASAYEYNGYAAGIDMVSRVLIKNYLNPKGTMIYNNEIATGKYYNGNTISGVNKKYATDKNWSNAVYKWMQYLYMKL